MKKNAFLTFLFSVIPGCGLMYLGYMKKGLQTMLMFAASGYLAYIFTASRYFDWGMIFFILLLPVIWFYQMFDSMHSLAHMKKMEMEVPMDDGFFMPFTSLNPKKFSPAQNPTAAKAIGGVLIIAGCYRLFAGILDYMYTAFKPSIVKNIINPLREYSIPVIISLVLIVIGVKLLTGSKPKDKYDVYDDNTEDEGM